MQTIPMTYFLSQHIWILAYIVWFLTMAILLVLENRNPAKTLAWLLVLALIPIFGFVLYLIFGQKYRKHKRLQSKSLPEEFSEALRIYASTYAKRTGELLLDGESPAKQGHLLSNQKKWIRLLLANSNAPVTENNRIEVFQNGNEAFQSIIQALENSRHHIHFEFYILKDDQIGREIQQILIRKAKEGVKVRVMYDGMGSRKLKKSFLAAMQQAGIEIATFLPVYFPWLTSRINFRNHRKIIVIDGKIGFTGGLNVGDEYLGKGPLGYWRDTHLKIEGDAVHYLQLIFLKDWYVAYNQYVSEAEYFPKQDSCQQHLMQIAASGPDADWEAIWQAHFSLIASAQKRIYIISPYLIPDESILMALKTAALSGLDVRMILPKKPEYLIVFYATRSYYEDLLNAGVRIYEYQKGFIHSKVLLVDSSVASVGTANLDVRSFQFNFEVNAVMYDTELVSDLERVFRQDLLDSRELLTEDYARRPFHEKLFESAARLLSPLL